MDGEDAIRSVADFETSELLLYKNFIYREMGDYQKALDHCYDIESRVCDTRQLKEIQGICIGGALVTFVADLMLKLGKLAEAEVKYRQLIDENPERFEYFSALHRVRRLSSINGFLQFELTLLMLLNHLHRLAFKSR